MHLQGQQLISRATFTSGRALSVVALAVILIHHFRIDVSELSVFGVALEPNRNSGAVAAVIAFMAIGHFVQWFGDHLSFKAWNTAKIVGGGNPRGAGGEDLPPVLDHVVAQMQQLVEQTVNRRRDPNTEYLKEWEQSTSVKDIRWTLEQLEGLQMGVKRLTVFGMLTLYGWHLFVPLSAASYAVYLLIFSG